MPLLQRSIVRSEISANNPAILAGTGEDHVQDLIYADTVGCMRQLMQLSTIASEIFGELAMLSNGIGGRLASLSSRTAKLQEALPRLKVDKSAFIIHDDEYQHHRQMLQNPQSEHLVDHTTLPTSLETRYCSAEVRKRVHFHALNDFVPYLAMGTKTTTIAQRYSNPEYFLHQWCTAQVQRMKLLEKEKRQHKLDKRARKKQRGQAALSVRPKRKSSVKWQERYMVDGKAVNRSSITGASGRGKRLSAITGALVPRVDTTTETDTAAEAEGEGEEDEPTTPKADTLMKRASHLQSNWTRTDSLPSLNYSDVYTHKSTRTFVADHPMNEATARDEDSASGSADSPVVRPSPPSGAAGPSTGCAAASASGTGAAVPPPPPTGASSLAAAAAGLGSLALGKGAKAPPPPPPPTTASAATTAAPASAPAAPRPPLPPAGTGTQTPQPPPPPPAAASHPSGSSQQPSSKDSEESYGTPNSGKGAPPPPPGAAASTAAAEDSDSESETATSAASSFRPAPPPLPAAFVPPPPAAAALQPKPSYLDEMEQSSAGGLATISLTTGRSLPPPPPPPPPPAGAAFRTTSDDDGTSPHGKSLLKSRTQSTDHMEGSPRTPRREHHLQTPGSAKRTSLRSTTRTASTDSVAGQLSAFNLLMTGGASATGPVSMVMPGFEDEGADIDHFAAVHDDSTTPSDPSPSQPAHPAKVSFLDAIKQGAGNALRKTPQTPEPEVRKPAPSGRESFLDAIKAGASGRLRKVDPEAAREDSSKSHRSVGSLGGFGSQSVAAILERRKYLMAEESDSDSDHDDGAWA